MSNVIKLKMKNYSTYKKYINKYDIVDFEEKPG